MVVESGVATDIRANSIHSNDALGIDLGGDGVTANDGGDTDSGANDLQNSPELATARVSAGQTVIDGTLDPAAGSYRVELFSSPACDPSDHGEGRAYLGYEDVVVGGGPTAFTAIVPIEVAIGHAVTATASTTATDPGNTSEFSACVEAAEPPADLSLTKTGSPDPVVAGEELTYTLTVDNAGPGTAAGVEVSDTLPAGVTFVSASDGGSETAGVVHWDLGTVAAADPPRVLTLVVRLGEARTAAVENSAEVTTSSDDPDPTDDTAAATTAVDPLTLTVNTASDTNDGTCSIAHCSLREAINRANGKAGADTIGFDIPGAEPHAILPTTALPGITESATLDATTQLGFAGTPVVEIDGSAIRCGPGGTRTQCGASGLVVDANPNSFSNVTIRGFAINSFATGAVKVCVGSCDDVPFPGGHGIAIAGGHQNVLEGNYIGTDVTGTLAKPNQGAGILVSTQSNRIGGTGAGQGNVISANGTQPYLDGGIVISSVYDTVIEGNRIGTGPAGTEALGNAGAGVLLSSAVDALNTRIGGQSAAAANTIAHNTTGVLVLGSGARRASITGNAIFANTGLGIDLGGDGVTPNDGGDTDSGPNDLQNFPELGTALSGGGQTEVTGSLDAAPATYRVELFASPDCDPSDHGEGANYLGFQEVTVAGGGTEFTATLPVEVAVGHAVTATATAPDGSTSELSRCVTAAELTGVIVPTLDPTLPPEPGVWSWGNGGSGALGSGSIGSRHVPGEVRDLDEAAQLAAGASFGLALAPDGTVESWGQNYLGQLGADPSTTACNPYGPSYPYTYLIPCRPAAAPVAGLADVVTVAAGGSHALALGPDGDVYAWGYNGNGELGVEPADTSCTYSTTFDTSTSSYTNRCRPTPEQVPGLSGIVAIAAGASHSLALDADGHVYSWGSNYYGELGVDPATTSCTVPYASSSYTSVCRPSPELVPGLSGIVAIAAGTSFSLAVDGDGDVYSWGYNWTGQLGFEPSETACDPHVHERHVHVDLHVSLSSDPRAHPGPRKRGEDRRGPRACSRADERGRGIRLGLELLRHARRRAVEHLVHDHVRLQVHRPRVHPLFVLVRQHVPRDSRASAGTRRDRRDRRRVEPQPRAGRQRRRVRVGSELEWGAGRGADADLMRDLVLVRIDAVHVFVDRLPGDARARRRSH